MFHKVSRPLLPVLFLLAAPALSGCAETKEQLGLTRRTPDEFAVLTRAPLEMPPEGSPLLPVPQPGMPRPQEVSPVNSAQTAVLGKPLPQAEAESSAEATLLRKAGATQSDAGIRATVNREAVEGTKDNRPVIKRLLSIGSDTPSATIVDAPGELRRLKENRDSGNPVTRGETPTLND